MRDHPLLYFEDDDIKKTSLAKPKRESSQQKQNTATQQRTVHADNGKKTVRLHSSAKQKPPVVGCHSFWHPRRDSPVIRSLLAHTARSLTVCPPRPLKMPTLRRFLYAASNRFHLDQKE